MVFTYTFVGMVGLFTAAAAASDIRKHRIPNYLTVPAAVLGVCFHSFAPGGWGIATSLAGFGVGFALLLLPWLLGGGGMGDVKLLAALGAWLGPLLMLVAFGVSILIGAVMALAAITWAIATRGYIKTQGKFLASGDKSRKKRKNTTRGKNRRKHRVVPFAVPVAASTWAILAWMVVVRG